MGTLVQDRVCRGKERLDQALNPTKAKKRFIYSQRKEPCQCDKKEGQIGAERGVNLESQNDSCDYQKQAQGCHPLPSDPIRFELGGKIARNGSF